MLLPYPSVTERILMASDVDLDTRLDIDDTAGLQKLIWIVVWARKELFLENCEAKKIFFLEG